MQQAASGGNPNQVYPWGPEWEPLRCNTAESGLHQSTGVGLYPAGASAQGVLDLSGNLWEWCLNKYNQPGDNAIDASDELRVVRGGSYLRYQDGAREASRDSSHPNGPASFYGFRLVCLSPIR